MIDWLRREAIEALGEAREGIRPRGGRKPVSVPPPKSSTRCPSW